MHGGRYRPDIDGLRALAVLAVVVFHFFGKPLRGGFVGVDVFFVISGYLITRIILGDLAAGSFTYRDFYGRRIRRILPALLVILAATAAAGWVLLRADEFAALGRHIAASALFVSNFLLWTEAGYFDAAAHTKPLLHLWSLAVEEQFYIVWPVILAAAWRWGGNHRLAIVAAIAAASFVACLVVTPLAPTTAFYWPMTRLWELALGGLLAHSVAIREGRPIEWRGRPPLSPDLLAAIGLGLIVIALVQFRPSSPFPGWRALLPAAGTACLIAAGPQTLINRFVLSNRLAVGIGLISYPLYLWHWPLISFAHVLAGYDESGTIAAGIRWSLLAASIALAWATYRFVERPIRRGFSFAPSVPILAAGLPVAFAFGMALDLGKGLPWRPADDNPKSRFLQHYIHLHRTGLAAQYRSECDFYDWTTQSRKPAIAPACTAHGPRGTWFLWGDSHAQSLSAGLRAIMPEGVALAQVATSGCRPSLDPLPEAAIGVLCDPANAYARDAIRRLRPDILFLARSQDHENQDWDAIARFAREAGVREVVLLGPLPQWHPSLPQVVVRRFWDVDRTDLRIPPAPAALATDRLLTERYGASPLLTYVSLTTPLCPDGRCQATVPVPGPYNLLAVDYGHLSPDGSLHVAKIAIAPALAGAAKRPVPPAQ
ncbi:acyltransferase family protein [Enterovirga rhinocerotis]|uniref:Peptidoglycan/LPS O-acetylase OafA/YrhL n=1 Tax=Enterovirga rhinocerotis TaxID=1339210 RepID=A0A4R7BUC3_9HYPH|nr:acyltransferase family protein [Enterovirga rhinocerotis]TDR89101.1 peptidoglycan/LPS O-acetylase OafA/YrhL [Enterovirga rhinocerotis]